MSCKLCDLYERKEINIECDDCTLQQIKNKLLIRDKTKIGRLKQLAKKENLNKEELIELAKIELYLLDRNINIY